jgi:hypothetical protein
MPDLKQNRHRPASESKEKSRSKRFVMHLVPCSCGMTFAVSADYDRRGTSWSRYISCPNCGKRHDPKNRLLELGYQSDGYWKVDKC